MKKEARKVLNTKLEKHLPWRVGRVIYWLLPLWPWFDNEYLESVFWLYVLAFVLYPFFKRIFGYILLGQDEN